MPLFFLHRYVKIWPQSGCDGVQVIVPLALMKRASNLSPKIGSPGLSGGAELRIPHLQATGQEIQLLRGYVPLHLQPA